MRLYLVLGGAGTIEYAQYALMVPALAGEEEVLLAREERIDVRLRDPSTFRNLRRGRAVIATGRELGVGSLEETFFPIISDVGARSFAGGQGAGL